MYITKEIIANVIFEKDIHELSNEEFKFCQSNEFYSPRDYTDVELKKVFKIRLLSCSCGTLSVATNGVTILRKCKNSPKFNVDLYLMSYLKDFGHTDAFLIDYPEEYAILSDLSFCCFCGHIIQNGKCPWCQKSEYEMINYFNEKIKNGVIENEKEIKK